MRKTSFWLGVAVLAMAGAVSAHPTEVPYESRGECETAFAHSSKDDRERLVNELGFFDTYGAAQRTFNDRFSCEYDADDEAWYIIDRLQL